MASLDVIISELLFTVVNNRCTVDNVCHNERKVVFETWRDLPTRAYTHA